MRMVLAAVLACLVPVCEALGQQSAAAVAASPGASRRLSLAEALDLARRRNLSLAAARLKQDVANAQVQIAGQRPNPSFSFSAGRDTPHESLSLDQPLEIGGKRSRRIELSRAEGALNEIELADLDRQIRRQVREAYYNAAFAARAVDQRRQELELLRRVQATAQARFDAGDIPQLEVFQAALETSRAEADVKVAQQEQNIAYARLSALLNEPPETAWELGSELDSIPEGLSLESLAGKVAANPELRHLIQEAQIEHSRQELLRSERLPNITVGVGLDANAPPDFNAGLRGQVALDLPLFSRNQGELAQSVASQRVLEASAAAERRILEGNIAAAVYEFDARRLEAQLYRDSLLPESSRLAGLAEESYQAGRAPIMTVLDAQRSARQLEREYLERLLAAQTAFAALEESVGVPLD